MILDTLSLNQLRILVTIEETGSFSAAGRKLGRVQSAVSQAIQALERAIGVDLFSRATKTPQLTPAGRVLVHRARQVLSQADLFENTAQAIRSDVEAELSIAVDCFVPAAPIIDSLEVLSKVFPGLQLSLYSEGIWAAEYRVRDGTADLGLCMLEPLSAQDIHSHQIYSMTLVPVVGTTHPLATETRPITSEILSDHLQLILTDPRGANGPSYGVVSPRVWRFVDQTLRYETLKRGIGWAYMPVHVVKADIESGDAIKLVVDDPAIRPFPPIGLWAIHRRMPPPRKAAYWLLNDLEQRFASAVYHGSPLSRDLLDEYGRK